MKPKLLFVYEHPKPEWWQDGLSAALTLLEEDFEITRYNMREQKVFEFFKKNGNNIPDFVLCWGAFGSGPQQIGGDMYPGAKHGLCIGGNSFSPLYAESWDILFCETDWIKNVYLRGVTTKKVKAFGCNADIFGPIDIPTPIVWDYLGVGSFSSWKRWERMTEKKGNRLVIGEYQLNNESESLSIVQNLLKNGVMCSPMVNPFDLASIYHYSRTLLMPSTVLGGGERSVIEARSSGLLVEVADDNPKLQELVDMPEVPDHHLYAKQLKEGIMSVL